MKVALIGPVYPHRGGIAHHTTLLDRALRQAGHDVLLVSFSRQYPRWLFPGPSERDPSAATLAASSARFWIDSLNPLTWLTTFRRIRAYRPDALVLPWWTTFWTPVWGTLALLNRLFLHSTLLFLCHNVLPHDANRLDRAVARLLLRHGDRFIVQSAAEAQRLRALLPKLDTGTAGDPLSSRPIKVVPHPAYTFFQDEFAPQPGNQSNDQPNHQPEDRSVARARLNLPESDLILLFFGLVREYKGLRTLLGALPHVLHALPQTTLVVAGEFWRGRGDYDELIAALDLQAHVILHDRYVPNEAVATYFAAADVLVAPYTAMTGSGVLQIAAALDLPVIGSRVVQQALHGGDAAQSPPTTSQELAADIVAFAQGDASRALELPVQSSEHAASQSWQRLVEAIVE